MQSWEHHHKELGLGPARLWVEPLPPWIWRLAAADQPGEAALCLALLGRGGLAWEGVSAPGETAPAPTHRHLATLPAGAAPVLLGALCAPLLDEADRRDLKALELLLEYMADYPGQNCRSCRDQQARGEGPPACQGCPLAAAPALAAALGELNRLLADDGPAAGRDLWQDLTRLCSARERRLLAEALRLVRSRRPAALAPARPPC